MNNAKYLLLGSLLAASAMVVGSVGCGDDDEDDGSGTGATGASTSSSGAGNSGNTGNEGGGGPGSGGSGNEGGGTGGGAALSCDTYCATVEANCTGDLDQWGDAVPGMCEATCAAWEVGTTEDTMTNTLGCHVYHAGASAGDGAAMHCGHAGPTGDGMCGATPCDNFCELAAAVCAGTFADDTACHEACDGFDPDQVYNSLQTGGDTFACRMYHLTAAAADESHCAHIVEVSATCN